MKNQNMTALNDVFFKLDEKGIKTYNELLAFPELYAELWLATQQFVNAVLRSRTSGKNSRGEARLGNAGKIAVLESLGITTKEDVAGDALVKIIGEKLDQVLDRPLEYRLPYAQRIVNNLVNDIFKKRPSFKVVPLEGLVKDNDESGYTYQDIIPDSTNDPERLWVEQETLVELTEQLKAKNARTQAQLKAKKARTRATILREIQALKKRPAQVLVRLAFTYLALKPRQLAALVAQNGCDRAYAQVLFEISKKYHIELREIRDLLAGKTVEPAALKANDDEPDQKAIAAECSRLAFRAKQRLDDDD